LIRILKKFDWSWSIILWRTQCIFENSWCSLVSRFDDNLVSFNIFCERNVRRKVKVLPMFRFVPKKLMIKSTHDHKQRQMFFCLHRLVVQRRWNKKNVPRINVSRPFQCSGQQKCRVTLVQGMFFLVPWLEDVDRKNLIEKWLMKSKKKKKSHFQFLYSLYH